MSNPKIDLLKTLEQITSGLSTQEEDKIIEKISLFLKNKLAICNKCGGRFIENEKTTKVEASWGYESTGKDTLCDEWVLCEDCSEAFNKETKITCSKCHLSIIEVMAELAYKNPRSSFYGCFDDALNHFSNEKDHCGLEYAKIKNKILCEKCYEQYVLSFKIPIDLLLGRNHDRLASIISNPICTRQSRDSVIFYYDCWLPLEETVKIRNDEKSNGIYYVSCHSYPKEQACNLLNIISFHQGMNNSFHIPTSWFREEAKTLNISFDETDLEIIDKGNGVRFGDFQINSASLQKVSEIFKETEE